MCTLVTSPDSYLLKSRCDTAWWQQSLEADTGPYALILKNRQAKYSLYLYNAEDRPVQLMRRLCSMAFACRCLHYPVGLSYLQEDLASFRCKQLAMPFGMYCLVFADFSWTPCLQGLQTLGGVCAHWRLRKLRGVSISLLDTKAS